MRTLRRGLVLALLLVLVDAVRGYSWSPAGHMLVGAIAYRELRATDPVALKSVLALLRRHPDYQSRWLPRMNALNIQGIDRDMYLFAAAARWPDDIRDNPQQNRTGWHFRDLPFKPAGQPASVIVTEAPRENLVRGFQENLAIVTDSQSIAARKAIALSWVFHMLGDVHQPLHTTALYTTQFSRGDRGGNSFFVRPRPGDRPVRLHAYWDGLVLDSERLADIRARATELQSRPHLSRAALRSALLEPQFENWASEESFPIGRDTVYLGGRLTGSTEDRMTAAPVLPPGYALQAQRVAERRLVLAAYRLADLLARLY
jgi:hypothetical protein